MKPFRNCPGTGKVQVRIRRAYIIWGADAVLSTRKLAEHAYPRLLRSSWSQRRNATRAIRRAA